jgi:plastocyanin
MTKQTSREPLWVFLALLVLACPVTSAQQMQPQRRSQTRSFSGIHGKITASKKEDPHSEHLRNLLLGRYPAHGTRDAALLINPAATAIIPLSEKAVVYLESEELNQGTYTPPDRRSVLNQKDLQFRPQVLPILVGTTVDFPNRDNLFHNVFSYSEAKEFDLGRYPRDDSRSVTFNRPGVIRVYCDIHSHMNANILVLPNPHFATPDDDGSYVIPQVPEGKYTIVFWYDRGVVERRPVELKAGEQLQVDFTL